MTHPQPNNAYLQRFRDLRDELHGTTANNGYFHPSNIPYHSVETLICEAPDHGHETTSEAFSYWAWLEAMHGNLTGDWAPLQQVFTSMESEHHPDRGRPADEQLLQRGRPRRLRARGRPAQRLPVVDQLEHAVGTDPIAAELQHDLQHAERLRHALDHRRRQLLRLRPAGRRTSQPSYMNTFQRGPQESVWETVPQPSWEDFQWGAGASGGYLPLFITGPAPAQQWRYTNAPDADARLVQAMYWANVLTRAAAADGGRAVGQGRADGRLPALRDVRQVLQDDGLFEPAVPRRNRIQRRALPAVLVLRVGRRHPRRPAGPCASAPATTTSATRTRWRRTRSPTCPRCGRARPTRARLDHEPRRQLEFYRWLQSADGGIAGGATNSLGGRYAAPPAGTPTFYGMFYQENPVYLDPGSNTWFGFQAWSMERVAEYY